MKMNASIEIQFGLIEKAICGNGIFPLMHCGILANN